MSDSTDAGRPVIGVDLGTTTIKAVALQRGAVIGSITVPGRDAAAAARKAVEGLLARAPIAREAVRRAAVTGIRAAMLPKDLIPVPVARVDEFLAIGRGGLHLSGLASAVVVSMGTGTAFVAASGASVQHLGGTALGGGTLQGLAQRMLGTRDVDRIASMAASGDLGAVDLCVEDIAGAGIGDLAPDVTASNLGKLGTDASPADLALGLLSLVVQNVALMAGLVARIAAVDDIVFAGKIALLPQTPAIVARVADLMQWRFLIPEEAEYATAVGAALSVAGGAAGQGSERAAGI